MFDHIRADFTRCCQVDYGVSDGNCKKKMRVWFNGYGLQALTAYRFHRWSLYGTNFFIRLCKMPLVAASFLLHKIAGQMYDIRISPQAIIGLGCYIGHFGGIRIGRCRIGKLCNINHQVEIGMGSVTSGGQVEIGDQVWIGAHSKILDGVCLGTGVAVSAGSVVAADIPAQSLVAGPSGRIIRHDYDNSSLLGPVDQAL